MAAGRPLSRPAPRTRVRARVFAPTRGPPALRASSKRAARLGSAHSPFLEVIASHGFGPHAPKTPSRARVETLRVARDASAGDSVGCAYSEYPNVRSGACQRVRRLRFEFSEPSLASPLPRSPRSRRGGGYSSPSAPRDRRSWGILEAQFRPCSTGSPRMGRYSRPSASRDRRSWGLLDARSRPHSRSALVC